MTRVGRVLPTALVLSLTPVAVSAQSSGVLLTEGIRAYRDLEFAAAVQLLRRALEPTDARRLSPADRRRALVYLGAAQVFRQERDQAVATFRTLVLADARFRPDSLVFPPRVTEVFQEVLQTTKAVALAVPREARLRAGERGFAVRAYATSRHRIDARVVQFGGGDPVATLYQGPISDSVVLTWNGLNVAGSPVPAGRYSLVVTSSLTPDQVLRSIRVPLDVSVRARDTLPWPEAPPPAGGAWDLRFVIPGAILGAGLLVPAALGLGSDKGARITLGLAFGTIGIVGGRRPATTSAAGSAEWRARVAAVQQENQRRRRTPEIVIRAGAPELQERAER